MARKVVRSAVVVINVWRLTLYAVDDRRPTDCETSPREFLLRITVPAPSPRITRIKTFCFRLGCAGKRWERDRGGGAGMSSEQHPHIVRI